MVSPSLLFGTDQASLTTSAGDVKGKLSASPNPSTQFCQGLGDTGIPLLSGSWQTLPVGQPGACPQRSFPLFLFLGVKRGRGCLRWSYPSVPSDFRYKGDFGYSHLTQEGLNTDAFKVAPWSGVGATLLILPASNPGHRDARSTFFSLVTSDVSV